MAAASRARREIQSMLRIEPADAGVRAVLTVAPSLSVLKDHFRDAPVLPGVCLIEAVVLAAGRGRENLSLRTLKQAKFLQAVVPGDVVEIDARIDAGDQGARQVTATLTVRGKRVAQMSLVAAPEGALEGVPG